MMFDKVDAIVLFSAVNRFYYSRIETSSGCVIITGSRKIFVTDFRYIQMARKNLEGWEVVQLSGGLIPCVAGLLNDVGAKVVGFEDEYLSFTQLSRLVEGLTNASIDISQEIVKPSCFFGENIKAGKFELVPMSREIAITRSIKTEDEISKIALAQVVAQKALNRALSSLKAGITEREFSAEILYEMQKNGADGTSFDTIVAFKENSAMPHHKTSNKKLEKNDIVLVDMGAKMNGYCSDMTRTFTLGNVGSRLEDLHALVLEGQLNAIKHIKAGMTCREADMIVREYFKANGFEKEFGHSLGHGVGIEVHESPQLSMTSNDILRENMVVTVEPGLYIEGVGGVRIEDMVVVKENGCINLTKMSKSLYI